ncbi:MAG: CDP-alcohol phosphatidyltransferase family protein [Vicinamibacterales bacterium]
METGTGTHTRNNSGLTAQLERRLLVWIAARLPRRIGSDHLSALAMAGMAAAGLSFAAFPLAPSWAAAGVVVSLAANWFGDSLDGTVARVRRQQRPRYGYYLDHVLDIAGSTMLLAGLACSNLIHPLIAMALLAGYLLVSAESYLATHASGLFRMSFLRVGPTELRLLLVAGTVQAARSAWISPGGLGPLRLFDLGGSLGVAGLAVAFVVSAARNVRDLYRAEPLPSAVDARAA